MDINNPSSITSFFSVKEEIKNNNNSNNEVQKQNTAIIMGDFQGTYNKLVQLSATLKSGSKLISGKIVNFYVNGNYVGQGITNSLGVAIFNYKVISTGTLNVNTVFNGDNQYIGSSKINKLSVAKLSEIKIKNIASVKAKTVKITSTIANLGYDKGSLKLTYILPKNFNYVKPKVSTGVVSYNTKTRVLTWTVTNLKVHKTNSATLTWNLKASKKGTYSVTPQLVKNNSIRLLSNNNLKFNIK